MTDSPDVAVIGGGPAGLMAAERLAAKGLSVTVYDRMPSLGRKFLMAGRGGLNLTHSEDFAAFVGRYGDGARELQPLLESFKPGDLTAWAEGLGQQVFVGSSGRIFPKSLKSSPLLRAWLARLVAQGVSFQLRHRWTGWAKDGALTFENGARSSPKATVLALGGASWPKLGSDGAWVGLLPDTQIAPLQPANSGFHVAWSSLFQERFAGSPLKAIAMRSGGKVVRGEAMLTREGIEGGAVYALSSVLRGQLATSGQASLDIDLRPDMPASRLAERLAGAKPGQSSSNLLRKAGGLAPAEVALLREAHSLDLPREPRKLAGLIKCVTLPITGQAAMDRAISTAGGVMFSALDENLMLKARPGVFVAGEMLDWDAPTGGYLLQACFATGVAAARGVAAYLT